MKKFIRDDQNWFAKLCKMIILCIPMMYAGVTMDNDFWFIINHGRYILAHGFTNIEPFTVHEGLAFSFEKWLTCIVFYKVYDWFGAWGMYIFMLLLFGIILALFYKACLIFSKGNENVSIILTAVIMSVLAWADVVRVPFVFLDDKGVGHTFRDWVLLVFKPNCRVTLVCNVVLVAYLAQEV